MKAFLFLYILLSRLEQNPNAIGFENNNNNNFSAHEDIKFFVFLKLKLK